MNSFEAYDRLAPHYRSVAGRRAAYIRAVDDYVVAHAQQRGRVLDVGSGDGQRAVSIAGRLHAARLVLCEPSARMAMLCRTLDVDSVWETTAECLPHTDDQFETVTCLWNVLGHLSDRDARIAALAGMRRKLSPQGKVFCDVNNRHNARAYGQARVLLRRVIDGVAPNDRRGDSRFEWHVGAERIAAHGHLFTPREMGELIAAAGLSIEQQVSIDYVSGAVSAEPWNGQLVYKLCAVGVRRWSGAS